MPKKGYESLTLEKTIVKEIDVLKKKLNLKYRSEVIKALIKSFKKGGAKC